MFATGQDTIVEDLLDGDLAQLHTGTVALGIRHVLCTPLRLVRYVERLEESHDDKMIGVLYLDSRERGARPRRRFAVSIKLTGMGRHEQW